MNSNFEYENKKEYGNLRIHFENSDPIHYVAEFWGW